MTAVERVRIICKEKGIAISRLEKDLTFGNGFLNPKKITDIPSDRLAKIADYLGMSADELLGIKKDPGPKTEAKTKDERLISWFRSLPEEKQKAILIAQDAPEDLL